MSAYVCSDAQFKALAIFAVRKTHGSLNVDPRYVDGAQDVAGQCEEVIATRYAALLLAENIRSVRHRYADELGDYNEIRINTSDILGARSITSVVILKLCDNLSYQSCESDDWETTKAHALLSQIKDAAIRLLPGYEEAPWGIDDLEVAGK